MQLCHRLEPHSTELQYLTISPNGRTLLSACYELVKLWDLETGQLIHSYSLTRSKSLPAQSMLVSPDWELLICSSARRLEIRYLWTGELIHSFFVGSISSFAISPDGKTLAVGNGLPDVKLRSRKSKFLLFPINLWNLEGQLVRTLLWQNIYYGTILNNSNPLLFSPNGQNLIFQNKNNPVGSSPCNNFCWDLLSGELSGIGVRNLRAEYRAMDKSGEKWEPTHYERPHWLESLAINPYGQLIASIREYGEADQYGGDTARLQIWNLEFDQVLQSFSDGPRHYRTGKPHSVMTPDGKFLVGGKKTEIYVWDANTGQELYVLKGHESPIEHLALTSDGKFLASYASDGIRIWSNEREVKRREIEPKHAQSLVQRQIDALLNACTDGEDNLNLLIQAMSASSIEVREAACLLLKESQTEIAREALWNYLPYSRMQCLHTIFGGGENYNYFSISSDSLTLIGNYHTQVDSYPWPKKTITKRSGATGKLLGRFYRLHQYMGVGGNEILVTYNAGTLSIENVSQPSEIIKANVEGIRHIAVSADGQVIVCAFGDLNYVNKKTPPITVWSSQTGELIYKLTEGFSRFSAITSVLISPDGKTLFSVWNNSYQLWNLQTGKLLCTFEKPESRSADSLAVSPDGKTLACFTNKEKIALGNLLSPVTYSFKEDKIEVWDLFAHSITHSLPGYPPCAMTPDGRVLVCCTLNNEIQVWDLEVGRQICTLDGHPLMIEHIAISQNREWIASCDEEQTIKIWGIP